MLHFEKIVSKVVIITDNFKSRKTRERVEGVFFLTECIKCGIQYVGQTTRKFCDRIRKHINDIKNKKDTANAMHYNSKHYNSKGHSVSDFRALIIEKVIPNDGAWLLEREDMWIKRLETKRPHGLSRND